MIRRERERGNLQWLGVTLNGTSAKGIGHVSLDRPEGGMLGAAIEDCIVVFVQENIEFEHLAFTIAKMAANSLKHSVVIDQRAYSMAQSFIEISHTT